MLLEQPPTYYNIRTMHHIVVTTANDCPKHVELIQRSIKLLLWHLVGYLYYLPRPWDIIDYMAICNCHA